MSSDSCLKKSDASGFFLIYGEHTPIKKAPAAPAQSVKVGNMTYVRIFFPV